MKILHTADLHLGVKTMGKDRILSQKLVLDEICEISKNNNVDVVLIAGDVYNTSTPSAEAEELFYDFVEKISNNGNTFVLAVSGNHDDPNRLCAGLPLAYKHNIVLAGNLDKLNKDRFPKDKEIRVVDTDRGFIKLQKGEEKLNVAYLPFDCTITEKQNIESKNYSELVNEILKECSSKFSESETNIIVSHLFVVGSKLSHDRTVSVGDVYAVSSSDFVQADYVALGHIHSAQNVKDNIYYSGATCKLRPTNSNLSVNLIETKNKEVNVQQIELKNTEKYEQIKVSSIFEAEQMLKNYSDNDLVELTIKQAEPLTHSVLKDLRKKFPCVCLIELELTNKVNEQKVMISRRNLSDKELFENFYLSKKGVLPRESLTKLFIDCKGEDNEAN